MLIKKIFFSIFFIAIGWVICNFYNTMKEKGEIPTVTTIPVKKDLMKEKISLTTKVCEKEVINITSSCNSLVDITHPKPGDYVEKGEILIELKKKELMNSREKEEFSLENKRKQQALLTNIPNHPEIIEKNVEIERQRQELTSQKKELEDMRMLYSKGAIAFRDIEKKEDEIKKEELMLNKAIHQRDEAVKRLEVYKKEIEIDIQSISLKIEELKNQIKGCVVLSPISGLVKKIGVEKNSKVEYGSFLISIATTGELIAKGQLKEANFFLVKQDQIVEHSSEALGKRFKGKVLKVLQSKGKDEKEDPGWEVVTSIEDQGGLKPGMELSTDIIIKKDKEKSLVIPPEALYEEDCVLVVENGKIKKKRIEIGESTTNEIQVLSGLEEGEKVVIQYEEELKEGMKVKE